MHGRPSTSPRPALARLVLGAALAAATLGPSGCGANINAVYESDARFEHCMALDSRPDVKPTLRRACWEEWTRFYTYGQTRDRVDHAVMRQRQLGHASDFDEGDWEPTDQAALAAPEPSSAMAPPPITASTTTASNTASTAPVAAGSAAPVASAAAVAADSSGSPCTASCASKRLSCEQGCHGEACEEVCAERYDRCAERCL